jgi:hypothetical protein
MSVSLVLCCHHHLRAARKQGLPAHPELQLGVVGNLVGGQWAAGFLMPSRPMNEL